MNLKKYAKYLISSLALASALSMLTVTGVAAAPKKNKKVVSFPSSFEITVGDYGNFVATKANKASTEKIKYIKFTSKTKKPPLKYVPITNRSWK